MMYGFLSFSKAIIGVANCVRDSGDRMWNAPNDDVNKVQENSIAKFGEKPCPYIVRFA